MFVLMCLLMYTNVGEQGRRRAGDKINGNINNHNNNNTNT